MMKAVLIGLVVLLVPGLDAISEQCQAEKEAIKGCIDGLLEDARAKMEQHKAAADSCLTK